MAQLFIDYLQKIVTDAIKKLYQGKISDADTEAEVAHCLDENFGHYQCNNALKLAKILQKNPREIATQILAEIPTKDLQGAPLFSKVEIAGAGFINFTLDKQFISKILQNQLLDKYLGSKIEKPQRIVIDFSAPNIAKELHVGHLRSTIIGDSLANLFEFLGNDVLRLNHVGDWGTQFGMLIAYLKEFVPDVLSKKKDTDLEELMNWYKASKKIFDEDENFKKRAQIEVVKLQKGDKDSIVAWQSICDISRKAFKEIYDLLNIKIIERGESFYNPYLQDVVNDLEKQGLITISNGAKCIFIEGFKSKEGTPLPVIVQKSDGGFNYDTTDIAAFRHRSQEEKADRIIIVTDAGQSLHFQMIYPIVVKAHYLDPKKTRFDHVTFGVVLGPDGKKFKTRSGETEKLIDLLNKAIDAARQILRQRLVEASEAELQELATALGVSAIKYSDLSSHRTKDYVFSYDKMLNFEGNTAAFLFYSYVRILGIKRKINADMEAILKTAQINLEHPSEISLGLHLSRFGEIIEMMTKDLLPNRLCDYLYVLAEKFNIFFRDCRVEGTKEQNQRLVLLELTQKVLKAGFDILGLKPLSRM
ncbi:MAG: arginine--tRNA ligase [Chlamydiae bacterium]|nr:arginine--tRNA ligase [Chlamydiota bacterium]